MSARNDVSGLLEQWRRLTEAEGEAIKATAWAAVKEIQAAKTELQNNLTAAIRKWTAENPATNPAKNPFRAEVDRLMSLEARNSEYLAAQFQKVNQERKLADRALVTLRKVKRSYVWKTDAGWDSYS